MLLLEAIVEDDEDAGMDEGGIEVGEDDGGWEAGDDEGRCVEGGGGGWEVD